jgi:UDP-glucose 4-epimerase
MKNKKNILIIGGTGFIGQYLYNFFDSNNEYNVYRTGRKKSELNNYIQLDLNNLYEIRDLFSTNCFEYVINTAGYIYFGDYISEEFEKLERNNINSIVNLMESFKSNSNKKIKLIHLSTMSVYGQQKCLPVKENQSETPMNLYGITKLSGEKVIKYYSDTFKMPALILRLPGIFGGDRKSGAIYHFIKNSIQNSDIIINTEGLKTWSPFYINTFLDVMNKLLNNYSWNNTSDILNISYGENIDIIDVAYNIREILNSNSDIKIKKPLDYVEFYMDNTKLIKKLDISLSFKKDLINYIKTVKEE